MSIVPLRIRKPTIFRPKKTIGQDIFKEIVKMAYEMGKADEQSQASKVFSSLMKHAFALAIESDWNINPSCVLVEIILNTEEPHLWDADKCELLFRYFVWKRGIKTVRKVLKRLHYRVPVGNNHLVYAYRGQRYCKMEICYMILELYVEYKMCIKD
nr:MAG: hypothetical protein [Lake Baikal virophage 12]